MNLVMVNGHGYVEPHYPASIEDSATVYNWYREHFARQTPVEEGQVFGTVRVINAFGGVSEAVAAESFTSDLPSDENLHLYVDLPETVNAPLQAGDKVGTVSIYSYDQLVKTIDLVVNENRSANLFRKIQSGLYNYTNGRLWLGVILIVLILASLICMVILLLMIRAQNRRRRYRRRRK